MPGPQFVDPNESPNGVSLTPDESIAAELAKLSAGTGNRYFRVEETDVVPYVRPIEHPDSPRSRIPLVAPAPSVYLAGPIAGLSYGGATDWRVYASALFQSRGIITYSPMRWKLHLSGEKRLGEGYTHPLSTPQGITARDRFDCQRATGVLFYLPPSNWVDEDQQPKGSLGTCIELGWADAARNVMVGVMDPLGLHKHGMIETLIPFWVNPDDASPEACQRALGGAIDLMSQILLP